MRLGSPHPINWSRLAFAVEFYRSYGFEYVEVPWSIPPHLTQALLGEEKSGRDVSFTLEEGTDLIGSAEQSFLDMALRGELAKGRYVALTPCFRRELCFDALHQSRFMKVELIHLGAGPSAVQELIQRAELFASIQKSRPEIEHLQGTGQIDLTLNGIEIGSYGWRSYKGVQWAYGTGLAEPRFSYALEAYSRRTDDRN